MAASADIFTERENWRQPLAWSAALHGLLFGVILIYGAVYGAFGGSWGSGGGGEGAMSVTLASSIPLPHAPVETENIVANESKGLTQSLPKVKEVPAPDAIPIPEKETKRRLPERKPRTITQQKPRPEPAETASNVVPFGQGGPVAGPYSVFSAGNTKGGFGFTGGGGDFGSRFGWYVNVVRQKVSENWLKYEVDPNIHDASRVYVTFDITRTGQPVNVQIEQSSGVPSLDQSAVRALHRIDSFGPLPNEYSGSRVSVEFWFDYRR